MRAARFALVRAPAAARLRRPPLARGAAARWSDKAKADSDAAAADAARDAKFDAADAARDAKFDQRDAKADAKTAKEDAKAQQAAKDEAMGREHAEKLANAWDSVQQRAKNFDWRAALQGASSELRRAVDELRGENQPSVLKRKVGFQDQDQAPTETKEFDPREAQLMVIEQEDTWKELRERLRKAPIISDILDGTQRARKRINETSAAKKVKDMQEDAREFWETSQNPLVYQASSIVDAVTAETDTAAATRELRRLDPNFSLEVWRDGVSEELCPQFVDAFIRGDTMKLKPWLSEGLFSRLSHEIRLRKEEGLVYDDAQITDCEKVEIIAVQVDEQRSPILVVQFMTQQVNCVRNREGDVVEGYPSDIRAYFYVMAFQREYDDTSHELAWRVVDFQLGGGEPYY
jgi:import inner membrane translocase subunit TIM44